SVVADIETALVIHELMLKIGIDDFTIRINNRQVLSGLLAKLELADRTVPLLRSLDKLEKIGRDAVAAEMVASAGVTEAQAGQILQLAGIHGETAEVLLRLDELVRGNEVGEAGVG